VDFAESGDGFDKRADGVEIRQKDGVLRLEVKAAGVIHVTYAPLGAAALDRASDNVLVKKDWPAATFDVTSDSKAVTLSTAKLKLVVEKESGALHYIVPEGSTGAGATGPGATGKAMSGRMLTTDGYRSLRPVEVNGEKTFHAEVSSVSMAVMKGFTGWGSTRRGFGIIAARRWICRKRIRTLRCRCWFRPMGMGSSGITLLAAG